MFRAAALLKESDQDLERLKDKVNNVASLFSKRCTEAKLVEPREGRGEVITWGPVYTAGVILSRFRNLDGVVDEESDKRLGVFLRHACAASRVRELCTQELR